MSNLNKEEIEKRIKNLTEQREQLLAQVNMCHGAIAALEALLTESKPEVSGGDTVK